MIARRTRHLRLGLLPRIEPRRNADGTFTYRYKHPDGRQETIARDAPGEPRSGVAQANRIAADLRAAAPRVGTLDALVREYLTSAMFKRLAPRTQADYTTDLARVCRNFGHMSPASITPQHVARYRSHERAEAPVRANRELAALSTVFQYGIEMHGLPGNPCRAVRRNPETPRSVKPSGADIGAVMALARKRGRGYRVASLIAATVAVTGFRRQDILRLTDFQTDENGPGIRVEERKHKPGEVPMVRLAEWSDTLRLLIREARTLRPYPSTFIFTNEDGSPYADTGFKTMWGRLQAEWRAGGGLAFTAHDMRSYFVSEKRERGESPETHRNPTTEARVYDRRRVRKTRALDL